MPADDLDIALGLLNTWDEYNDDPELLRDHQSLARFLRRAGYERAAERVTPEDVEPMREVRERLRRAWSAATEDEAVTALNAVLAETDPRPRLARAPGGEWSFAFGPPSEEGPAFLAALSAAALLGAISEHGWERFGVCDAAPCRCVYVDRTHGRSRRFCCRLCADRASQAAYRARRATKRPRGPGRSRGR
jgi:predicted RNA-binding Zn ribbon-like protein